MCNTFNSSLISADHVMFLGQSLVQVASLVIFLTTTLPPNEKDPPGVFDRPLENWYDYIVGMLFSS